MNNRIVNIKRMFLKGKAFQQYNGLVAFLILLSLLFSNPLFSQKEDFLQQAKTKFESNQWEEGKKILDDVASSYKIDSDYHLLLGKYYHHKGNLDKARFELNTALKQNPNNVDAKQILVNVEMESERYSSAICYVNELLEVNPYYRGLWLKKIEIYQLQGNEVEANRLRKRLKQIYPDDTKLKEEYLYHLENESNLLSKSGNSEDAINAYRELISENNTKADYYIAIVNLYLKNGDEENAMSYLNRGLNLIPNNNVLINKKVGLLAKQGKYDVLLAFLKEKNLTQQYNYYLLEAARHYKDIEPATLYGKIFYNNPGNVEAFNYVFAHAVANLQFDEALHILKLHKNRVGASKDLAKKEILVYLRMGYEKKAESLTRIAFKNYPNDVDLRDEYVAIIAKEARQKMQEERYASAIDSWYEVMEHGDLELQIVARTAIVNCYINLEDYTSALNAINELIFVEPNNHQLLLQRADIYLHQKEYDKVILTYKNLIDQSDERLKNKYKGGISDILTSIVKENIEEQRYPFAQHYIEKWLEIVPDHQQALKYGINVAYQLKQEEKMLEYAIQGNQFYPEDYFFKLKIIEIKGKESENYESLFQELYADASLYPYREDITSMFSVLTLNYGKHLIKNNEPSTAIEKIDITLSFVPKDMELLYLKGIAYEKLKMYDSAYYYQGFYNCAPDECDEFKRHLNYLFYKSKKNVIGIYHLRTVYADEHVIRSISTIEYMRHWKKNTFIATVNYSGRPNGKGYQTISQWDRTWTDKLSSMANFGWGNMFFPRFLANASVYYQFNVLDGLEIEGGLSYKKLNDTISPSLIYNNLYGLNIGGTQYINDFSIGLRLNNYFIDFNTYLFNLTLQGRHYLGAPNHWITALTSVGTAPNQELLNYNVYKGLSTLNTMVGAGYNRQIYKNINVGIMGTWINFKPAHLNNEFKNIHNLYGTIQIAF